MRSQKTEQDKRQTALVIVAVALRGGEIAVLLIIALVHLGRWLLRLAGGFAGFGLFSLHADTAHGASLLK